MLSGVILVLIYHEFAINTKVTPESITHATATKSVGNIANNTTTMMSGIMNTANRKKKLDGIMPMIEVGGVFTVGHIWGSRTSGVPRTSA